MDRYDALVLIGWLMITIGCGLIYFPAALIVGGIGCMAIAVIGARGSAPAPSETMAQAKPQSNKGTHG